MRRSVFINGLGVFLFDWPKLSGRWLMDYPDEPMDEKAPEMDPYEGDVATEPAGIDLMDTIGIDLEPERADITPPVGTLAQDLAGGALGALPPEEVARISANVAATVKDLVMERIDHILTHAITEAVEAELKKLAE